MVTRARALAAIILSSAAAAIAGATAQASPIETCAAANADLLAVRACLRGLLTEADQELSAARDAVREAAARVDADQAGRDAGRRVDDARTSFANFREAACRLESAVAAGEIDASVWEISCAIARTRARALELRRLMEASAPALAEELVSPDVAPDAAPETRAPAAEDAEPVPAPPAAIDVAAALGEAPQAFRDWRAGCGASECGAATTASDEAGVVLLVAPADGGWEVRVGAANQDTALALASVSVRVDARAARVLAPAETGAGYAEISGADANALVAELRAGGRAHATFVFADESEASAAFSLIGATAAMNASARASDPS